VAVNALVIAENQRSLREERQEERQINSATAAAKAHQLTADAH
jgi:hypothetical protein